MWNLVKLAVAANNTSFKFDLMIVSAPPGGRLIRSGQVKIPGLRPPRQSAQLISAIIWSATYLIYLSDNLKLYPHWLLVLNTTNNPSPFQC